MMIKQKTRYFFVVVFFLYMMIMIYFLFFAEATGRSYAEEVYRYNLVPFQEITRYIRYADKIGFRGTFLNLEGNVLAFVPFGILLPIVFEKCRYAIATILLGAGFSICVEAIQLFSKVGSCDVDDVILNTCGAAVGYFLFFVFCKHRGNVANRA